LNYVSISGFLVPIPLSRASRNSPLPKQETKKYLKLDFEDNPIYLFGEADRQVSKVAFFIVIQLC
jgi:hypothetical protein